MRVVSLLASGTEIVCRPGRGRVARRPVARMRQPAVGGGAAGVHATGVRRLDVERADRRGSAAPAEGGRAALSRRHRTDQFPGAGPADHAGALRGVRGHAGGRRAGRLRRRGAGAGAAGRQRAGNS